MSTSRNEVVCRKMQEVIQTASSLIQQLRSREGTSHSSTPITAPVNKLMASLSILSSFAKDEEKRAMLSFVQNSLRTALQDSASCDAVVAAPKRQREGSPCGNQCEATAGTGEDLQPNAKGSSFQFTQPNAAAARWSSVIGAQQAITALQQAVVMPQRMPHLFTGARKPWKCILLYGPPGTGKTMLAAATAAEAGVPFVSVSASDLLSKWVGETEKLVRELFASASTYDRCIIFLDEIDAICSARGGNGETELSRRVKTEFLVRMQSVDPHRVTIIAATNLPWELDTAFRRRFDRLIYVGLPSSEDLIKLIKAQMQNIAHSLTEENFVKLGELAHGLSPCDIMHMCQHALMLPIERLQGSKFFRLTSRARHVGCHQKQSQPDDDEVFVPCNGTDDGAVELSAEAIDPQRIAVDAVSYDDLCVAIRSFPKSNNDEYVARYFDWEATLRNV